MKKFLLFWAFAIFVIVILPSIVVLIFGGSTSSLPKSSVTKKGNHMITVLKTNTGHVEKVDIEEYLYGVLAGEMPASFHIEALKAQAVAARTYILNKQENGKDSKHPDADICTDSTHCKAWLSEDEIVQRFGSDWLTSYKSKIVSAIEETNGLVMVYNNEPIVAVFHSTSSGRTENSADVWGGDLPYLKSVDSPGDAESPKFYSEKEISKDEFSKVLSNYKGQTIYASIGDITHTEGGSVKSIVIGGVNFSGNEIRNLLSLQSANFTAEEVDGKFKFSVKGNGHGVGLSQYGANYYAKNGKSFEEILKIYYQGVDIVKY